MQSRNPWFFVATQLFESTQPSLVFTISWPLARCVAGAYDVYLHPYRGCAMCVEMSDGW